MMGNCSSAPASTAITFDAKSVLLRISSVARLYITGSSSRRYRRASTLSGPGEPLVLRAEVEREFARIEALVSGLVTAPRWLPVAGAPRDGTPVLLRVREVLAREDLALWQGLVFVGRWRAGTDGWSFAAPVGVGGFPDEGIAGWMHVPGDQAAPLQV